MFHSVGLENHPWAWSQISEPVSTFEAKIALIKKKGFTGVFWKDLYEHMAGLRVLPDNSILLTFDDGYLDNWVYVYSILKKYEMKGTVFVNPEFVDPRNDVRSNLDDVTAGRCQRDELSVAGFLSWAEMREMESSGLIDIQSHAMTHTWYFSGPKIVGFHQPQDVAPYPWLFWNARPDRKPFYLNENQQNFLPFGYPILEYEKSLITRRFFPDTDVVSEIAEFVATKGGREFFRRSNWRAQIENHIATTLDENGIPGHYESDEERIVRITDELQQSKTLIENNLGKTVEFLCWPGGGHDETIQQIAEQTGYKSWTLSSRSLPTKRNRPGADPACIKRMATTNQINVRGRHCGTGGEFHQLWRVFRHQGSKFYSAAIFARKLLQLVFHLRGSK